MQPRRVYSLMLLALMVLSVIPFGITPTLLEVAGAPSTSETQLPRVALVKLWSITHTAYMAKFVGEKYVVVFEVHGDVSLDGRYISSWKTAWVYRTDTGELLATLTPDTNDNNGDTWEVTSWEPFQYIKVWDTQGFFSADSKRMIESPRILGTNAKVVDTTSWTTISIDWGFTDTDGSHLSLIHI